MKKIFKNKRALSPIFSTVLLILLVVVGITVTLGFFINYVKDYQAGSGSSVLEALEIEDVWFRHTTPNDVTSYVDTFQAGTGTHSNFVAQQLGPDGLFDTLTEANNALQVYYPSTCNPQGGTTQFSGSLSDLQATGDGKYVQFHSYPSKFSGTSTLGYTTKGSSTNDFSYVRGSRFTTSSAGQANSISVNLAYSPPTGTFGNQNTGSYGDSIENTIRGQRFTSPSSQTAVQSISAYIYCSTNSKTMKAAIYEANGNLVASTNELTVPASTSAAWRTFTFTTPPTLAASTNYVLVAWSQSGTGNGDLRYSSTSGGNGRYSGTVAYGSWPSTQAFTTNTYQYSIYCNYVSVATFRAQAAIYTGTGGSVIAVTEEKTLGAVDDWVTFNFASPPTLAASTQYVLVAWASSADVDIYYNTGTAGLFRQSGTYPNWPASVSDQGSTRTYSIYCTIGTPSEYTCSLELAGNSNVGSWTQLVWTATSGWSASGVSVSLQLYNYNQGGYLTSGPGCIAYTSASVNTYETKSSTVQAPNNSADFRDSSGTGNSKLQA